MSDFTKLSDLVNKEFTIKSVKGYKFKSWDNEAKRMISEDRWFEGARKMHLVETDKGLLDLSSSQLGTILEGVQHAGRADVNNLTVAVKSNGKTGQDIRYYLNPQRTQKPATQPQNEPEDRNDDSAKDEMKTKEDEIAELDDEPINLDDIPL